MRKRLYLLLFLATLTIFIIRANAAVAPEQYTSLVTRNSGVSSSYEILLLSTKKHWDQPATVASTGISAAVHPAPATFVMSAGLKTDQVISYYAADLDGDKDIDIAVGSYLASTVSIYLNNGSGQFTQALVVATVGDAVAIVAADLDGDSDKDLLIANQYSNLVSIRLNDGRGKFYGTSNVVVDNDPIAIALADWDQDGDMDLASANSSSATVSIRLNNGKGVFSGSTNLSVGDDMLPAALTAVDVDQDGDTDIITANDYVDGDTEKIGKVSLLINKGQNNFALSNTAISVGKRPRAIGVADFDQDGDFDIATANSYSSDVSIRLNDGSGNFTGTVDMVVSAIPSSLCLVDFDNNGSIDIATNNAYTNSISVLLNDGSGKLKITAVVNTRLTPDFIGTADFNSDGQADLATFSSYGNEVGILVNKLPAIAVSVAETALCAGATLVLSYTTEATLHQGNVFAAQLSDAQGSFLHASKIGSTVSAGSGTIKVVIPTDLNGANYKIRVVSSSPFVEGSDNGTSLSIVNTCPFVTAIHPGQYAALSADIKVGFSKTMATPTAAGIKVYGSNTGLLTTTQGGSFSGGGSQTWAFNPTYPFQPGERISVIVTTHATTNQGVSLTKPTFYEFTAASSHAMASFDIVSGITTQSKPKAVVSADFDKDGDIDIAVANGSAGNVSVKFNDGVGLFSGNTLLPVGTDPVAMVVADIDGDGDTDLIVANAGSDNVSIYANNGSGSFSQLATIQTSTSPQAIVANDLDGDGDLDLVTADADQLSIFINNGSGTVFITKTMSTGIRPQSIVSGDVDRDGDVDLVLANFYADENDPTVSSLSVLINDGKGSFSVSSRMILDNNPSAIQLADLDQDHDLDVIAVHAALEFPQGYISLFLNDGSGVFSALSSQLIGYRPQAVYAADFDGDDDADIIVANRASDNVSVLINTGAANFKLKNNIAVAASPTSLSIADFDGSGTLDFAVAASGADKVSFFLNKAKATILPCTASGTILREFWANVSGTSIGNIPANAAPSSANEISLFESPTNIGNNYATRIRGYICVPQMGEYVFWIAGDDNCELRLSTDENPANRKSIALVPGSTSPRQWNKYTQQKSAPIFMIAGHRYYIEALQKEGSSNDHVSVGWQLPNGGYERPIPGSRLSPAIAATRSRVAAQDAPDPEVAERNLIVAYPNPASSKASIQFTPTESGSATLSIYDTQGGLVKHVFSGNTEANVSQKVGFDCSRLPTGLYVIRLVAGDATSHYKLAVAH